MVHSDIIQQISIEHDLIGHVMQSIRTTMDWKEEGEDSSRKLSTLRFIVQSFQRLLDRLFGLEEFDGYMDRLVESCPHLGHQIEGLRHEHDQFRESLGSIMPRLERVSPTDHKELAIICEDLHGLLDRLEEHSLKEMYLIQEGSMQVVRGEEYGPHLFSLHRTRDGGPASFIAC
jgi:hemerythrin-like domain-containing protein